MSVAYCTAGSLILYSGVKGATLQDTVKAVLSGNLSLNDTQTVKSGAPAAATGTGATPSTGSGTATGAAGIMLNYMKAQVGKPYSEDTSTNPSTGKEKRFGPQEFDCSGLVYAAANQPGTGINLPESQAIASSEADWFSALQGSQVVKNVSLVQVGDIMFFTGASPDPSKFGPIGHVGICSAKGTLLSAYDTAMGITYTPVSQDGFVVAVRI